MFEIELDTFKFMLYKLIRAQYDQEMTFDEIAAYGADLYSLSVDNLDIILDMIGFPEDNSVEYDIAHDPEENNPEYSPEEFPIRFDRSDFRDQYFAVKDAIEEDEQMMVSEGKMEIIRGGNEMTIFSMLSDYIDWLFKQKDKLDNK